MQNQKSASGSSPTVLRAVDSGRVTEREHRPSRACRTQQGIKPALLPEKYACTPAPAGRWAWVYARSTSCLRVHRGPSCFDVA